MVHVETLQWYERENSLGYNVEKESSVTVAAFLSLFKSHIRVKYSVYYCKNCTLSHVFFFSFA